MSQAQKEKIKLSPKQQMQGNHEGIKRPRRLEAQTKKHPEQKKKRKPWQGIRSQDPQQPSRDADPFRHKVKGRLGQLERKRQKKKIRNKAKNTSASKTQRPLMAQTEKASGNQNREAQKKNDNKRLSSWQNRIPPRWERKGKSGTAKTVMPRRAYLSTSQRRWPTRDFQKNQS